MALCTAVAYYGADGLGLEVTHQNLRCATSTGGGGHVTVTGRMEGKKTVVDLETREWDYHARKFMREIA